MATADLPIPANAFDHHAFAGEDGEDAVSIASKAAGDQACGGVVYRLPDCVGVPDTTVNQAIITIAVLVSAASLRLT